MSRHADRQAVARELGATHVVAERGEAGLAQVRELTEGIGADCVLKCVGTEEARAQAVAYARPGGMIGLVGVRRILLTRSTSVTACEPGAAARS